MIIFNEGDIRQTVQLGHEAISVVEEGFTHLANGKVSMPPIMRVDLSKNNGEVDVKTAYIEGMDQFAIKISAGFFNNYKLGLPSGNGMMILLSTKTGVPKSVLLDNGYLTDVRTAAAGAVAANYLAKEKLETVGVIGAGSQARYQVIALKQVRNFNQVIVYGPTAGRVEDFAREIESELQVKVIIGNSAEMVVKESELVITATPSKSPIIKSEWLHPGLHITAMGSDAEHKQELDAKILSAADLLVCDVKSQCFRLGELHHGLTLGVIDESSEIYELGELTSGRITGRMNDEQITVCDLTGTGVQDTVIAVYAFNELMRNGKGLQIDNSISQLK